MRVLSFVAQSLRIALPYLAAAMGGVWSERAGVVNVALEGTILAAALFAVFGTTASGSPWIGLLCALAAGVAIQLLHVLTVLYGRANAIISGIAINLLAAGGTRFLLRAMYGSASNSPSIPSLVRDAQGARSLFSETLRDPSTFIVVALVGGTIYALRATRFGLRVRAVGEHPEAAANVGVSVARTRIVAVSVAGAATGLSGAWLAFDQHQFSSGMSGGRGFIALSAVIVGGWRPGRAALFCVLFGAAEAAQIALQDQHAVPHQIVQMFPYLLTLVALAGLVGRSRPPAALGKA